jgi:hypothetical protein
LKDGERVRWMLDEAELGESDGEYAWKLERGTHVLNVSILYDGKEEKMPPVTFYVK